MNPTTKGIVKFAAKILITGGLLLWVFSRIGYTQLVAAVSDTDWLFLPFVWGLTVLFFWVQSWRMRLILGEIDCIVTTTGIFQASAVAMLYSLVLGDFISTGVKWYILKEQTGKASNVLSAMFYNQASLIVINILIGLLAVLLSGPSKSAAFPVICLISITVIVSLCLLLLNKKTGTPINKTVGSLLSPLPDRMRKAGLKVLGQLEVFQTVGWGFHLRMTAICLIVILIQIIIYFFAAKAAGIDVPITALAWQAAVVYLLGRLPISIANLGVREVTLIEFLKVYGIEPSAALLMSMALFSAIIFMAAIGAVYQIAWTFGRRPKQEPQSVQ